MPLPRTPPQENRPIRGTPWTSRHTCHRDRPHSSPPRNWVGTSLAAGCDSFAPLSTAAAERTGRARARGGPAVVVGGKGGGRRLMQPGSPVGVDGGVGRRWGERRSVARPAPMAAGWPSAGSAAECRSAGVGGGGVAVGGCGWRRGFRPGADGWMGLGGVAGGGWWATVSRRGLRWWPGLGSCGGWRPAWRSRSGRSRWPGLPGRRWGRRPARGGRLGPRRTAG